MLPIPTIYAQVSGSSEGGEPLTAFDRALLGAGIGDVNLLKVSSIVPPHARRADQVELPAGALVPVAYGAITSEKPGERIAAAVAIGIGKPGECGVITEHSLVGPKDEAEQAVRAMVLEAFRSRGRGEPQSLRVKSAEHVVERVGCAFAGVVLWYG